MPPRVGHIPVCLTFLLSHFGTTRLGSGEPGLAPGGHSESHSLRDWLCLDLVLGWRGDPGGSDAVLGEAASALGRAL